MTSKKTGLWRAVRMAGIVACGQCAAALVPVEVSNSGFEDGTAGWGGGKNMAIDGQVAHGGRRSISLTVDYPKDGRVYITRQVPVEGGARYTASCFVKTENVTTPPEYKASVGAGLIVEWADKNGKWMQGGQYACERRGTTDWTKVTCDKLLAPDAAGYACIYLALRDSGKAWFDDFTIERVDVPVDKLSPADGVTLANNCPRFTWRYRPGVRAYTLELSRDPSFPAGKTRAVPAGGHAECLLETPLEPGVWHWRVSAPGSRDEAWTFTQTAPLDRDCLPPRVLTKACRVTDAQAPVRVQVKDEGPARPTVTFGAVTGVCEGAAGKGLLAYSFAAPAGGWAKGFTEGEVVAVDAAGNRAASKLWLLNAPPPANGVKIGDDGFFWQEGRRIFPLGIYEVPPKDLAEVRQAGYDVVHMYRWEGSQDDAACRQYLDQCWATDGLRAFVGFDRGAGSRKGMVQGNFAHVARRVGALADHPGLFCWYLFDEPEILQQFIPPDRLTEFADLVRALDPFHPVVMTTWNNTMNQYRRTWDTHWTQAYGDPAGVVRMLNDHRRLLKYASPITLLVNCNDGWQGERRRKEKIQPDPAKFARDYDHLRACAFLGIVKECNGLWWWWFARDRMDYYSAAQVPKAWADLVSVVKEIGALRPLVTAAGPVVTGAVKCGEDATVEWWAKTVRGKTTLIAVNTAGRPTEAKIAVPWTGERTYSFRRHEVKIVRDLPPLEDCSVPVRPGCTAKGVPFWNGCAALFRYAPAFGFKPVAGAAKYRFTLTAKGNETVVFEANSPEAALSPVWNRLANVTWKVTCAGVDAAGKTMGTAGERAFTKLAPFASTCAVAARPYRDAARKIYEYMTSLPAMTTLVETGVPDQNYQHNAYPSKTHAAHIGAMLRWAAFDPANKEKAMRFARASGDYLLSQLEPADAPLAFWPPTYGRKPLACDPKANGGKNRHAMVGNDPEGAAKYRGQVMTLYPADVGIAFLALAEATGDAKYREAAERIGETYLKIRRPDGTWALKYWLATGEIQCRNTLVPTRPMRFFEALADATGDAKWRAAAAGCFVWMEKGPLADWNWDGQFEDILPRPPYQDLTKHNAIEAMFHLLKERGDDPDVRARAREILRWSEDQFVFWEAPCAPGEAIPSPRKGVFKPGRWHYPSVYEQYSCYISIDASAAKLIAAYLAMYRAERNPLDLAKARALADAITRVQKPSGRVPTFWAAADDWISDVRYDWLNCMAASAAALLETAKAVDEAPENRR